MYCCRKFHIFSKSLFFRSLGVSLDNIYYSNMFDQINEQNKTTVKKINKRQIVDTNDTVVVKVQKLEVIEKVAPDEIAPEEMAPKEVASEEMASKEMAPEEMTPKKVTPEEVALKEVTPEEVVQRIKRKNFVIMMGYFGRDYFGMQKNPHTKTIEADLLTALLKANLITKDQYEDIREIKFQRAARTDKGVSAVRQIVSLKLPNHANKEEINKYLPKEIRVFSVRRVTKGFNSKNQCDARTYRYVIPTFALAPEDANFLQTKEEDQTDPDKRLEQLLMIDGKPYNEFRLTASMLDKVKETLMLLEGTHNFHNFTSKIKSLDPRAQRYIMYFQCIETFVANNMEFAMLEIKGQSFMLHQIRKMISLVVGISRNIITNDTIKDAFSLEKIDIPTAPGLGLSLHYVHYKYYNTRYGSDGIHESLAWEECNEEVEQFYKEYILKSIVDTETTQKTTLNWLASFLTPNRFAWKDSVSL